MIPVAAYPWSGKGETRGALHEPVSDPRLLRRSEEAELITRAQRGDRPAQERLINANLRLIYRIARRYRCRSYSHEDLVQEGIVGLMQAIDRWDPERGCRLSTYAVHWIRQAIARAVEQNDRLIHVPLQATVDLRRLVRLREDLERVLGRTPNEGELADAVGLSEDRVRQLLGTIEDAISLEALVGGDEDTSLMELAEDPDALNPEDGALMGEYREMLRLLVGGLRPRERWVVEERFGFDGRHPQTLEEISRQLQVSRERVRQIEARAIQKLRHALKAQQWD